MTFFLILWQNSDQFNSIEFSYDIDQKKKFFISGDHAERKKKFCNSTTKYDVFNNSDLRIKRKGLCRQCRIFYFFFHLLFLYIKMEMARESIEFNG